MSKKFKNSLLVAASVVVGTWLWDPAAAPEVKSSSTLATRYYARNRTADFFQRSAVPVKREAGVTVIKPHSAPPKKRG